VLGGAIEPQFGGPLGQLIVQFTPALVKSFVTVAATFAVALTFMLLGGKWLDVNTMEVAVEGVIVTVAVTDFVLSAVEVAVMVTVLPEGTVAGAVKTIGLPLTVCGGVRLNVPQPGAATAQITLQSTPLPMLSFVTVAIMVAVPLTGIALGGAMLSVTEITGTVTVIIALANLVPSVTEVAVMVTAVAGTTVGAV
jgi:hypothetical protein